MSYSTKDMVETFGQLTTGDLGSTGYDYVNTIQFLINTADRAIDDYCDQPEGFFNPNGVEIENEYHDGIETGHYGIIISLPGTPKRRPFLRLKYTPVLSVTTLEHQDSGGTWTTLTEGRQNDYLVMENGIRYIRSAPHYDYKNVRVIYKAGYSITPGRVSECSARLAAVMAHRIIDSKKRDTGGTPGINIGTPAEFVGLAKACFTDELKDLVRSYRRKVPIQLL